MKFHTIYESTAQLKNKPIYVILNSYSLEGKCAYAILSINDKFTIINNALNTILSNIDDSYAKGDIITNVLASVTKTTESIGLEWAIDISHPLWMSEEDFLSNFKEVIDESKLPPAYKDYLVMMRS